jgi:diacylglycerol kinase (ATP)
MENHISTSHKALIIHSPRAGRSSQLSLALDYLRQAQITIADVISIKDLDKPTEQGMYWQEQGVDLVVAAGGDGLIGGVIPHVLGCGLPVGILPLGTANDVARTLEIPLDISKAAQVIVHGAQREIDLGVACSRSAMSQNGSTSLRDPVHDHQLYFAHALTVGLNVQFARLATDGTIREQYGSMTYPYAVFEALRNYESIEIEVTFDELLINATSSGAARFAAEPVTLRCRAAQTTVVNAPIFWGVLQASVPGVSMKDRLLDIVVVEDDSLENIIFRVLRFFRNQDVRIPQSQSWHAQYPALFPAELTAIPGIHHVKARSVTIKTLGEAHNATLDGEVRGQTPIQACVADRRLRLIVPN